MLGLVGGDILKLITSGMYSSPLAIYREYLQNAADSISSSSQPDKGKVEINLSLSERCVTIRDYGPGLSHAQAKSRLIPISQSGKRRQHDRGFRGIGRLSGLAFGNTVKFLTRHNDKIPVIQITWNGDVLRNGADNQRSVDEIISQCVTVEKIDGDEYPANFFEVQIHGIPRFLASSILNQEVVRQCIRETCPVPFAENFPYMTQVADLFEGDRSLLVLDVRLNEDINPVTKLYSDGISGGGDRFDKFIQFEAIKIPASDDKECAAAGWIAHSSYLGALRKSLGMGGLRVRVGNIQIGDDTVFNSLFTEDRFNRWCVGEIHILDSRIIPNGRRDYFESSVHLRNLENHLSAICRKIEQRCRTASKRRNERKRFSDFMDTLNSTYDIVTSGYLTVRMARQFTARKLAEIPGFRNKYTDSSFSIEINKLNDLEKRLINFQIEQGKESLAGISPRELPTYRKIFAILAETSPSPQRAKQAIETILAYQST